MPRPAAPQELSAALSKVAARLAKHFGGVNRRALENHASYTAHRADLAARKVRACRCPGPRNVCMCVYLLCAHCAYGCTLCIDLASRRMQVQLYSYSSYVC